MKKIAINQDRRKFWSLGAAALASIGLAPLAKAAAASKADASQSIEERLAALERVRDAYEIANLQGRYEAIHNGQEPLSVALFAKRSDTSKEITRDKLIGYDTIVADYKRMAGGGGPMPSGGPGGPGGSPPNGAGIPGGAPQGGPAGSAGGAMPFGPGGPGKNDLIKAMHPLGTPVIVVADDGKTAKATFTSLGFEGNNWCYGKYANSYIKIDGQWYIWHMKWLRCFKTPYNKAWYDQTEDEIYEFAPQKDANGKRIMPEGINFNMLAAPGKEIKTIACPRPYKTWTKEDEDGGWWKRETTEA